MPLPAKHSKKSSAHPDASPPSSSVSNSHDDHFTSSQLRAAASAIREELAPLKERYGLPPEATSDDLMVAFGQNPGLMR